MSPKNDSPCEFIEQELVNLSDRGEIIAMSFAFGKRPLQTSPPGRSSRQDLECNHPEVEKKRPTRSASASGASRSKWQTGVLLFRRRGPTASW